MQNYTIPLLGQLYDLSKVAASSALSGYMIASAVGMAAGGFLVSANPRTERTVMVALILAGLTLVVLALAWCPPRWPRRWWGWRAFAPAWRRRRATC